MDSTYHIPVLLRESVDFLVTDTSGIYIDGTLGGGGHTAEILLRLSPNGRLISFDADAIAIAHCQERFADELAKENPRLTLRNENFVHSGNLPGLRGATAGLLLDLGTSSRQLDSASRGISHRINSRLDMRFGNSGVSAEEILNDAKEDMLIRIFREYGEEPFAVSIVRRIIERRRAFPLKTTNDLRIIIQEIVPPHLAPRALARVFQALRIAVNDELGVLEKTLRNIIPQLSSGGRIVVISYHSLEDRIVKNTFREFSTVEQSHSISILTPKPLIPSSAEIASNPRSRSAKLRIAEKI